VRALVRAGSDRRNLVGLDVEIATGDLTDAGSLRAAVADCTAVFHVAADYRLWVADSRPMYAANVEGSVNVLEAAAAAGTARMVYTSSVAVLGINADRTPADETTPVEVEHMIGHYKRSKFLAEREAEKAAQQGLDVVIVNPSTPVGELDVKPTPTGQIIVDFLAGRMPAYVDTGLNLIDVRDVAAGHLLAADRGRMGRRYILGNRDMSLIEIFRTLESLTGIPSPRFRVPHWIPWLAAAGSTLVGRLRRRPPAISLESVRMSRYRMYFDASRAVDELGLPQTPVEEPLARAVAWFRGEGYVDAPA